MRTPREPILALDASPFAIRVAVSQQENDLLDTLDAKPHEISQTARFVLANSGIFPGLKVVGCPLDGWPPGLELALREQGTRVDWLSPRLMRNVVPTLTYWNRKRRIHRARLLAYLAYNTAADSLDPDGHSLAAQWERIAAQEILDQLRSGSGQEGCRT